MCLKDCVAPRVRWPCGLKEVELFKSWGIFRQTFPSNADESCGIAAIDGCPGLPYTRFVVLNPGVSAAGVREAGQPTSGALREALAVPQLSSAAVQRARGFRERCQFT